MGIKFFNNISERSKVYLIGLFSLVILFFLLAGIIFLCLISSKLDIVMSQPAGITYTLFIQILDRLLIILSLVFILPLTIYLLLSKENSALDKFIKSLSCILFIGMLLTVVLGEYRFYKKYKDGELSNSVMYCSPSMETNLFDKILLKNNVSLPIKGEICK